MQLFVLDDEQRGYARLQFDANLAQTTLGLAIELLSRDGFLGPSGTIQKGPHYFTGQLVEQGQIYTVYRVGPEIVNHIRDQEYIGVSSADGTINVTTHWENAIPEISTSATSTALLFRERERLAKPGGDADNLRTTPKDGPTTNNQGGGEAHTRIDAARNGTGGATRPEPPKPQPPKPPKPGSFKTTVAIGTLASVLGLACLVAWTVFPCQIFGRCPVPIVDPPAPAPARDPAEEGALAAARECASVSPCGAEACIAPYLARFPGEQSANHVQSVRDTAMQACKKIRSETLACAAAVSPCRAATCFATAPAADVELQARRQDLAQQCADARRKTKECLDLSDPCAASTCLGGLVDLPNDAARRQLTDLQAKCVAAKAEDGAFNDASTCASANPCVAGECFEAYLKRFNSGPAVSRGNRALQDAAARCRPVPPPSPSAFAPDDGVYSARVAPGCGNARSEALNITVSHGTVTWEHQLNGVTYRWSGRVDPAGSISATVSGGRGYTAIGTYSEDEKRIEMTYPGECQGSPLVIEFGHRIN